MGARQCGLNRTLHYSLLDSAGGVFSIDPGSGVVALERPLDRELQDSYRLRVQASDRAGQQGGLATQVDLTVLVLDVNDNAPVFQRRDYAVTVPEDVAVGTEVLRVSASSADVGPNAEISYSIRSGNELGRFSIDTRLGGRSLELVSLWGVGRGRGTISVALDLDHEVCPDFYLAVEAWDGGTPPLSAAATVTVQLMDVNDNAPVFSHDVYNVLLAEDAPVGHTVARLQAEDPDSRANGRITYSILTGDRGNRFWMDPVSGALQVYQSLDRELASHPPGASLLSLEVSDPDGPRNGAPFRFRIASGNEENYFSLDQTGTLRSSRALGPRAPREFSLEVQASDSGHPSLTSSSWVDLRVMGHSQFKPSVSPLEVYVVMVTDSFPGGLVGRVHASDRDAADVLTYDHRGAAPGRVHIGRQDGSVVALPGLEPGRYQMNVTVSDGRFAAVSDVTVRVERLTEAVLRGAVVLRFRSVSPEDLLGRYLGPLRLALRSPGAPKLWPTGEDLPFHLLGVQRVERSDDVDLILALERPAEDGGGGGGGGGGGFFSSQEVSERLEEQEPEEARLRGQGGGALAGLEVLDRTCSGDLDCGDTVCEQTLVVEPRSSVTYTTERISVVVPTFTRMEACTCPGKHHSVT
ncbi:hypothetical protein CRUP_000132 [Coryphaenoides rupestris]|nr:hypothetical protein CRUP_000132 [Coryphaenoides rupestris]